MIAFLNQTPPRCEMRRVFLSLQNKSNDMEQVNHPQHYTTYDVETLDMMIRIWGIKETISFCKLNAFKYRMRARHQQGSMVRKQNERTLILQ